MVICLNSEPACFLFRLERETGSVSAGLQPQLKRISCQSQTDDFFETSSDIETFASNERDDSSDEETVQGTDQGLQLSSAGPGTKKRSFLALSSDCKSEPCSCKGDVLDSASSVKTPSTAVKKLLASSVKYVKTTLDPGDMLFLPSGWFHSVEGLGDKSAAVNWYYKPPP